MSDQDPQRPYRIEDGPLPPASPIGRHVDRPLAAGPQEAAR